MTRYKAILFDCDGTLVDSELINAQGMADILIKLGHKQYTTEFCLKHFIGCSSVEIINTLNDLQIQDPSAVLHLMHEHSLSLATSALKPITNAIDTLNKITFPKCVVSNGDRRTILHFLELTTLNQFFPNEYVFTREQVKKPKPSPDLYLLAADKMKTLPKDCLVIEDSVIGITAAKKAGMKVLGFTGANSFHEHMTKSIQDAGADHIINNLLQIFEYL
ncbi:MAG: HAD family phosphatase [Rickettsiales bacterium]|nr:HAD family phosphatase [Rickettsiales bacterium]